MFSVRSLKNETKFKIKIMKVICKIIISVITLWTPLASFSQSSAKGYVYEDSNTNGKKDRKEKGISGVSVSNGVEVQLTDENGFYKLPVGNDNILFVIKPANYNVPLNNNNQPLFYYIHKPNGSPDHFKYKGVSPTGKLPNYINFALIPAAIENDFTALIFGDPQPYTIDEVGYFSRSIVSEVEGIENIKFGLSLGDLVGDNLDLHQPYIKATSKVGVPWYNVIGNHDVNWEEIANDSLSDETFELNFGPTNYSFNEGKVHFIILDDILYSYSNGAPLYSGGLRKDQFDFIENDLKFVGKDNLVVLAFHIPLKGKGFSEENRQRLFDILKDYPHTLSLSAHTHIQRHDYFAKEEGFHREKSHHEYNVGTTCGGWWSGELDKNGIPDARMGDGTPKGYAFLNFQGNDYTIDYKVAGNPSSYQIGVFIPKVIPYDKWVSSQVYANFFIGKKGDKVEYRFDDGDWKDMDYTLDIDPTYTALLYTWDVTEHLMAGRRPNNPTKSTHLWKAHFPYPWESERLSIGKHFVEIRATDMFDQKFTIKKDFLVEETVNISPK